MNGFKLNMNDWHSLTKINRTVIPLACLFLGGLLVNNVTLLLLLPIFPIILIYASSASLNDIFDLDIDKISNPIRPIPSHKLDVPKTYFIVILIFLAGIFSAYLLGYFLNKPYFVLIALAAFFLGIIYCVKASNHFITANAVLATTHGFLPFISGVYLFGNVELNSLLIGFIVYTVLFLTYNIKDFKDVEGDSQRRITLPTAIPENNARKVMSAIFFLMLPIALLSNFLLKLSGIHLIVSITASLALIWLGIMMFNGGAKHYEKILNIYRHVMVIYIISFGL